MRIDYTSFPNDKFIIILSELTEESYDLLNGNPDRLRYFCEQTGAANVLLSKDVVHIGPPEEKEGAIVGHVHIDAKPDPDLVKQIADRVDFLMDKRGGRYIDGNASFDKVNTQLLVPDYHVDSRLVDIVAKIRYTDWREGLPESTRNIIPAWDSQEENIRTAWRREAETKLKGEVGRARNTEEG